MQWSNLKQAISARERALCQLTVCFEFQSGSEKSFRVTTDLLNRENFKVGFTQLCNELKGCNFTVVYLTQKCVNNTFKENTINPIVIKLQLTYSTVGT